MGLMLVELFIYFDFDIFGGIVFKKNMLCRLSKNKMHLDSFEEINRALAGVAQ